MEESLSVSTEIEEEQKWSRLRSGIFVASWILYATYYFCRKNLAVVMPLMAANEQYQTFDLANLVFVFSLAYSAGQFLAGLAADRFGARVIGTAGALVSASCNAAMAIPGPHWTMLALQIGNGIGQGCGWSSCLKVLGRWFVRQERGTVMAWWSTCYILGGFLATVFATWSATQSPIAPGLSWRRGFLFPAIVLSVGGVLFLWKSRNRPEEEGLPAIEEEKPVETEKASWLTTAKNPEVMILAGMYFFLKITRYSLLFWLPLYLVQRMHYSTEWAGYTSSLFELVGFLGALIAGYVSDRLLNGRRYPVGTTMLFGLAAALLIHPAVAEFGMTATAISISVLGILIYGPDMLMSGAATVDAVPPAQVARALGIVNGIGSLGQLISAYVVALIVSRFGWDSLFTFFVGCSVAAGGLLTLHWNKGLEKS